MPRPKRPFKGPRSVRIKSRPLEQIDEAKLALALSLMARRLRSSMPSKPTEPKAAAADDVEDAA